MYRDLLFYYQIDLNDWLMHVGEGKSPQPAPRVLMALIEGLPDTSMTYAMAAGGMEHFGWGHERHLLASTYDALNSNTVATGQWKKGKAPKIDPWPRPKVKKKAQKKKGQTVADIYRSLPVGAHVKQL